SSAKKGLHNVSHRIRDRQDRVAVQAPGPGEGTEVRLRTPRPQVLLREAGARGQLGAEPEGSVQDRDGRRLTLLLLRWRQQRALCSQRTVQRSMRRAVVSAAVAATVIAIVVAGIAAYALPLLAASVKQSPTTMTEPSTSAVATATSLQPTTTAVINTTAAGGSSTSGSSLVEISASLSMPPGAGSGI